MSSTAATLAGKLAAEGEKTLAFFSGLPAADRDRQIFHDGARWTARGVLEHLILSEASLLGLFQNVVAGGPGAAADFDIERFNREHTGQLAGEGWDQLLSRYTATRHSTVEFTRELSDTQLAVRGRHPALGDSSVEDMLKLIHLHHTMHVRDVRRGLATAA
jgi:hypothetical protein